MNKDKIILYVIAATVIVGLFLVIKRFKEINKTIAATSIPTE